MLSSCQEWLQKDIFGCQMDRGKNPSGTWSERMSQSLIETFHCWHHISELLLMVHFGLLRTRPEKENAFYFRGSSQLNSSVILPLLLHLQHPVLAAKMGVSCPHSKWHSLMGIDVSLVNYHHIVVCPLFPFLLYCHLLSSMPPVPHFLSVYTYPCTWHLPILCWT